MPLSPAECIVETPNGRVDLTALTYGEYSAECDGADPGCEFFIRVCGSSETCNPEVLLGDYVSACQIPSSGSTINMGRFSSRPSYTDGEVMLQYTSGDACTTSSGGPGVSSTKIIFQCDPDAGFGNPEFEVVTDDCQYIFIWRTAHACITRAMPDLQCTITGHGYSYDLHALLRQPSQNDWVARTPAGEEITLNVCGQLRHPPGHACEGAAMCLSTQNGTKHISLGYALTEPVAISPSTVQLLYSFPSSDSTDLCANNIQRSAEIVFECAFGRLGQPVFVTNVSDCFYSLSWSSYVACNLSDSEAAMTGTGCSVVDPISGNVYNLDSLPDPSPIVDNNYTYYLGRCGNAPVGKDGSGSPCSTGSGACQVSSTNTNIVFNAGLINSTVYFDAATNSLYTKYVGGQACHHVAVNRVTYVFYVCSDTPDLPPRFMGERDCVYFFEWETPAACPTSRDFDCIVNDPETGDTYDLTPLKLARGSWNVETTGLNTQIFELNICRSVNDDRCPSSAGGCAVANKATGGSGSSKGCSMGRLSAPKFYDGGITAVYKDGDCCPSGTTTTISFVCSNEHVSGQPLGVPLLSYSSGCNYHITWATSAACKVTPSQIVDSCSTPVINYETGEIYSFASMNKLYNVTDPLTGQRYLLNPCQPLGSLCKGSMGDLRAHGCQLANDGHEYSTGVDVSVSFADDTFSMIFLGGHPCHGAGYSRSTLINFICGPEVRLDCGFMFMLYPLFV